MHFASTAHGGEVHPNKSTTTENMMKMSSGDKTCSQATGKINGRSFLAHLSCPVAIAPLPLHTHTRTTHGPQIHLLHRSVLYSTKLIVGTTTKIKPECVIN